MANRILPLLYVPSTGHAYIVGLNAYHEFNDGTLALPALAGCQSVMLADIIVRKDESGRPRSLFYHTGRVHRLDEDGRSRSSDPDRRVDEMRLHMNYERSPMEQRQLDVLLWKPEPKLWQELHAHVVDGERFPHIHGTTRTLGFVKKED